ncbi:hypothetical protein [Nonomuraea sp. SYSU D8015]|uniref:hypothetical protein n=1 Tax=Nonomuraea sp. SYSU D8015 TaxID=2593644 RepID=UPI001CB75A74|nr:hypothetical protein [Nonomuraea sp. SYSU D8015]
MDRTIDLTSRQLGAQRTHARRRLLTHLSRSADRKGDQFGRDWLDVASGQRAQLVRQCLEREVWGTAQPQQSTLAWESVDHDDTS